VSQKQWQFLETTVMWDVKIIRDRMVHCGMYSLLGNPAHFIVSVQYGPIPIPT